MHETVKEIISPGGKYKATILEKLDYYSLDIYILTEDLEPESGIVYSEYWSRKNKTPILVDKKFSAEYFVINELRVLMGEPDIPLSIEWIRDFSFCKDAKFLNLKDVTVFSEWIDSQSKEKKIVPIEAKTIIDFDGLCLVEESGYEGEWQMGKIDSNQKIYCWGYYGSLKEAIIGL